MRRHWGIVILITIIGLIIVGATIKTYYPIIRPPAEDGAIILHCETLRVEGMCIDVSIKTTIDGWHNTPSKYEFPDLVRVNDFVAVQRIVVVYKKPIFGKHPPKSPKFKYTLEMSPLAGPIEGVYPEDYAKIVIGIPELNQGDVYEINYLGNDKWETTINGEIFDKGPRSMRFPRLYRPGDWIIRDSARPTPEYNLNWTGYSSLINGDWSENELFRVYSPDEIADIESAIIAQTMGVITLIVMVVIGVVTVIIGISTIAVEYEFSQKIDKTMRRQIEETRRVSDHIIESGNRQLQDKKLFERNKRKNILSNLSQELETNVKNANEIISKKEDYTKKGNLLFPTTVFLTTALGRVVSDYVIEEDFTLNELAFQVLSLLLTANSTSEAVRNTGLSIPNNLAILIKEFEDSLVPKTIEFKDMVIQYKDKIDSL